MTLFPIVLSDRDWQRLTQILAEHYSREEYPSLFFLENEMLRNQFQDLIEESDILDNPESIITWLKTLKKDRLIEFLDTVNQGFIDWLDLVRADLLYVDRPSFHYNREQLLAQSLELRRSIGVLFIIRKKLQRGL